jgi:hypothetical protein
MRRKWNGAIFQLLHIRIVILLTVLWVHNWETACLPCVVSRVSARMGWVARDGNSDWAHGAPGRGYYHSLCLCLPGFPSAWRPHVVRVPMWYSTSFKACIPREGKQTLLVLLRIQLRTGKVSLLAHSIGQSNQRPAQIQRTLLIPLFDGGMTCKYIGGRNWWWPSCK